MFFYLTFANLVFINAIKKICYFLCFLNIINFHHNLGCWETSRLNDCHGEECLPQKTNSQTMFCCCNANFCNANITKFDVDIITTTPVISK